jgi:hypothetical protein
MRYAKHKITGKVIATQSGDDNLQGFKDSGLGYDESELEIGIATAEQIRGWREATVTDLERCMANRKAEYPSIQALVVALYDTDDKAAIDAARAAIKAKYPKP